MKKKILVIAFTNLKSDPRVNRQILALTENFEVSCLGLNDPEISGVTFFKTQKRKSRFSLLFAYFLLLFRFYNLFYWNQKVIKNANKSLGNLEFDLILANDAEVLPFADYLVKKTNAKLVFDSHEYAPKEHEESFIWTLLFSSYYRYILKKYSQRVSLMFTVCSGLADEFNKEFGFNPLILTNASDFYNLKPSLINEDKIRIIHHGGAIRARKLENMILMMDYLDERFELDFMLVSNKQEYINDLKKLAKNNSKIRFLNPVSLSEIIPFTNNYDIGVFILEPTSFNYYHALPNKLFEFIQARLMVAVGPSPEMSKIVIENEIGVVSESFSPKELAKKLNQLSVQQIRVFKENAHLAASKINSKKNMELFVNEIDKLFN